MRILTNWSKTYLLPFILCFAIGLTGCQEEEIIPLDPVDLTSGDDTTPISVPNATMDISKAQDIIYDEHGEVIGYLDGKLDRYDVTGSRARTNQVIDGYALRAIFYEGENFMGVHHGVYSAAANSYSQNRTDVNVSNISSMVVPAGCTITLHESYVTAPPPRHNEQFYIKSKLENKYLRFTRNRTSCEPVMGTTNKGDSYTKWRTVSTSSTQNRFYIQNVTTGHYLNFNLNSQNYANIYGMTTPRSWRFKREPNDFKIRTASGNKGFLYVSDKNRSIATCSGRVRNGNLVSHTTPRPSSEPIFADAFILEPVNSIGTATKTFEATNEAPMYINLADYGWSDRARSYTLSCNSTSNKSFCGYAYKNDNYTGDALPLFEQGTPDISGFSSWDNAISSISTNSDSDCDGLMVYDNGDDFNQSYHWVSPDQDISSLSAHGVDNNISRILHTRKYAHHFRDVDFNIGFIGYDQPNYQGQKTIFPKSGIFKFGDFKQEGYLNFASHVTAPSTSVTLSSTTGTAYTYKHREGGPGDYLPSSNLPPIRKVVVTTTTANTNDFCGVLWDQEQVQDGIDEVPSYNQTHFPVFKGMHNFPTDDGNEIFKLKANYTGMNNHFSTFTTYSHPTSCEGVTLWNLGGHQYNTGTRRWIPVDADNPQSFPLTDMNDIVSGVTTEGCRTPHLQISNMFTLADLASSNARVSSNSTNTTVVREIGCEGVRLSCLAGQGAIVAGCAVGAAKLAGLDIQQAIETLQNFQSGGVQGVLATLRTGASILNTVNERMEAQSTNDVEMQSLMASTNENFHNAVQSLSELAEQNAVDLDEAASPTHWFHPVWKAIEFIGRAAGATFGAVGAIDGSISFEGSLVNPSNNTYFCSRAKNYCLTGEWQH